MASLSKEVFAVFGDYEATLPRYLRLPGVETTVCHRGGHPVAFLMTALLRAEGDESGQPDRAEILAIAVSPQHQGKGLGRTLLEMARRWAKTCGWPVETLQLNVAHDNHRAMTLFQTFGFEVLNPTDGTYEGGQRSIKMALRL